MEETTVYSPRNDPIFAKLAELDDKFDLEKILVDREASLKKPNVEDARQLSGSEKQKRFLRQKSNHIERRLGVYELLLQYDDQVPDTKQSMVYSNTHKVATNWWQPLIAVLSLDKRYKVLNKRTNRKVTAFLNHYGNSASWGEDNIQDGKISDRTKRHKTTYKDIQRANRLIKEIILDSSKKRNE